MNRKICIVTPCLKGPINNGGIGTAVYYLSRHIVSLGLDLDILFTGPLMNGTAEEWNTFYNDKIGANLYFLEQEGAKNIPPLLDSYWINERSLKVHLWLKNRRYDQIHFQDYNANGFIAIQSKKSGIMYQKTLLTCALHSSFEWMQNGNAIFPQKTFEEMVHVYMEHYCAANADMVISPTRYMLQWYRDRGYPVNNGIVVQNLFDPQSNKKAAQNKIEEICFFGRLETRKGLEDFVQTIKKLSIEFKKSLPKISFLGRPGLMSSGISPYEYIRTELEDSNIDYHIDSSKNAFDAIKYLKEGNTLAIVASKSDNLPYVVVECLQNGIPVMASNVGGIPELIESEEHLFHVGQNGLIEKLRKQLLNKWSPVKSGYDPDKAATLWTEILYRQTSPESDAGYSPEDVTICIPYFNYPDYLPELLESLDKQTVSGFKVIVINDGSTQEDSNRKFEELSEHYNADTHQFIARENKGISYTRNEAARLAETKLLIFMDSDNLAMPDMVDKMVRGMNRSGLDCLTCYAEFFEEGSGAKVKAIYPPVGPCLQAGLYYNIFGDANFIIRRESFENQGGFDEDRSASFEDWEFLARFSLSGMKQDVIPEVLFRYRITASGFSRNTGRYGNFNRIVRTYSRFLPDWGKQLVYHTYTSLRPDLMLTSGENNDDIKTHNLNIFSFGSVLKIDLPRNKNIALLKLKIPIILHSSLVAIAGGLTVSDNTNSKTVCVISENGNSFLCVRLAYWISQKIISRRIMLDSCVVRKSKYFDENWYNIKNHDVASSRTDPAMHYLLFGWKEGRNPGPHFSTTKYTASNPKVDFFEINPLVHYERFGKSNIEKIPH